jgi:hypothetical protein
VPWPRGIDLLPDAVRDGLDPGEVPLAWESATQLAGHTAIGGGPERPAPGVGFSADPLAGGVTVDQGWVDAKVGGVNAWGAAGSRADAVTRALDAGPAHLLLTDRRLAVVVTDAPLRGPVTERLAVAVDRRELVAVERAPRLLQRGRVRLRFVDGSWAMAMMGVFSAAPARRLIAAAGG